MEQEKTTTIARLHTALKIQDIGRAVQTLSPPFEQIERHAENWEWKLIKHQQGADPAAVIL